VEKVSRNYELLFGILDVSKYGRVGPERVLEFLKRYNSGVSFEDALAIFRRLELAENPYITSSVLRSFLDPNPFPV
jgi:hypothetical protein